METKYDEWKVLQLFTAVVVAMIFSSALSNSALIEPASISESTIEERLVKMRKHIQQRGEELISSYFTVYSRRLTYLEATYEWDEWDKVP